MKPTSIRDAIRQLEMAAGEKAEDFKEILGKDYEQFKKAIEDLKPYLDQVKSSASSAVQQEIGEGVESVKKVGKEIDTQVHENPWLSLGIVGLFALLLGFLLGRSNGR